MNAYLDGYANGVNWAKAHKLHDHSRELCLKLLHSFLQIRPEGDKERGLADAMLDAFGC